MFAYAAPQHPEHADDIARVLAVPGKRFRTTIVTHLTEEEITALLRHPIPAPGQAAATTPCCWPPSPPACAPANWPGVPAPTPTWATAPTWNVTARAGKTG